MGTDVPKSMGFNVAPDNKPHINLKPSATEADRLFAALAASGKVETQPQEMFWGAYFGSLMDRFGIQWMFNCVSKS